MRRKVLLIGGGHIAAHYKEAFERSDTLQLVALADVNTHCYARHIFEVPFFEDAYLATKSVGADTVLLAVPPLARYDMAIRFMKSGVDVICEKPFADSLEKVDQLIRTSASSGAQVACMLHWMAADEVIWLKNNISQYGDIKEIHVTINDDYASRGHIRRDRLSLLGAWIDSGINALSYLSTILDINSFIAVDTVEIPDVSCYPLYARKSYIAGETRVTVEIDWRRRTRNKKSIIVTQKGVLEVNHTKQTVSIDGKCVFNSPTEDRLASHYINLLKHFTFENSVPLSEVRTLHKLLYGGNPNEAR